MLDPQGKTTGTGTLLASSTEVLQETPDNALPNAGELEKVEKLEDRREIYRANDQKRVDLDLGRQETDQMAIERLDIAKNIEAQREEFEVLRSNVRGVLVKLFKKHKPEELRNFDTILTLEIKGIFFHPNEEAALAKLREIASNPDSPLARDYAIQWKTDVESAFEGYKTAVEIKNDMEQGNEKGRYTAYIKEHPYRFAGLVALGAVGAYSIYRWLSKKKEEKKAEEAKTPEKPAEEKKGILGKIWDIGKIFALSFGAVSLGVMLGPESWKEWVKKYVGVNLTGEALKNFWKKIKEGKVVEAFGLLHEEKETFDPEIEKAAKAIGIEPKYLSFYIAEKAECKDFLEGNYMRKGIYEMFKAIPKFKIPFWIDTQEEKKLKEAEIKIGDYLQKYEKVIKEKLPHAKTLEEVIRGLANMNIIDEDLKQKEATGESQEELDPDNSLFFDGNAYDEFIKSLDEAKATHLKAVIEEWNKEGFSFLKSYKYVPEIMAAAWEDKFPILKHEGTVALWTGTKLLVLTSFATLSSVFDECMRGEYSNAVTEYWNGAKVFVPIGAAIGGLANLVTHMSISAGLQGAVRGSAYGFLTPAAVPLKLGHFTKRAWIRGKTEGYKFLAMIDETKKTELMVKRTQYLYQTLDEYYNLNAAVNTEASWLKHAPKKIYAHLTKAHLQASQQRIAGRLISSYQELQGLYSDLPNITKFEGDKGIYKIHELLEDIRTNLSNKGILYAIPAFETPVSLGSRRYSFRGEVLELTAAEETGVAGNATQLKTACEGKWSAKKMSELKVEEIKLKESGKYSIKINGEVRTIDVVGSKPTSAELDAAKTKFLDELKDAAQKGVPEKMIKNTKLMQAFIKLSRFLGPTVAAYMIYDIETAENKPEKLGELGAMLLSFVVGYKTTRYVTSNLPGAKTNPKMMLASEIMSFLGGLATAFGINEPIEKLIQFAIEKIPGRYEVADNVTAMVEKNFARLLVTRQFTKNMLERGLGRKLMTMEVKSVLKKVLPKFGWRGLVSIGVLSDDWTVIGIIDDLLLLWMGKDVVDILWTIKKNVELKQELELIKDKKEIVIKEERKGEETFITMTYEGYPNLIEWTVNAEGNPVGIKIVDVNGKEVVSVTKKDAEVLYGELKEKDDVPEAEDNRAVPGAAHT